MESGDKSGDIMEKADSQQPADAGKPPAAIVLDDVSFAYSRGAAAVVDHVSLRIAAGDMVGLLGPNGAGKSTLLRLATRVLRPTGGRVLLQGDGLGSLDRREIARRVAVVPQDFSVQFAYTVRQIVEMGRMPRIGTFGIVQSADHQAVQEALDSTGMLPLAGRIWSELSGGEKQRALIALALAQDTPILLLDEPTAHLDIRHQIEVLELLRRLNRERGLAVLAALHDLNLAARYFPRLVLFAGRVIADGPPAQVLDEPTLSRIYQTPVQVGILRGEEHLSVLPPGYLNREPDVSSSTRGAAHSAPPEYVHVVAGGGSGELMMRALADAGVEFVAGPLNVGDSDAALAERLAHLCILEPPFAPVSDQGLASARERMLAARAVVICPMPLGAGNVGLLALAYQARLAGVPVFLFEPGHTSSGSPEEASGQREEYAAVAGRDYSETGVSTYQRLVEAGAQWVHTTADLVGRMES
jgi:iron complex transport system ATP-binding protein